MSKLKKSVTALMISAVGAGGMVLSAAPAGAGAPATTLSCTVDGSLDRCTVSDSDGLRTVQVKDTANNVQQVSFDFEPCGSGPSSVNFNVPTGTKYKVFVTDCETPRNKTTFVIRADGTVN